MLFTVPDYANQNITNTENRKASRAGAHSSAACQGGLQAPPVSGLSHLCAAAETDAGVGLSRSCPRRDPASYQRRLHLKSAKAESPSCRRARTGISVLLMLPKGLMWLNGPVGVCNERSRAQRRDESRRLPLLVLGLLEERRSGWGTGLTLLRGG